jgi:hypothetical protein
MPDLSGFDDVKIVPKLSPYSTSLFALYNGTLPYAELIE